jgi:hypothetical protein
MPRRRIAVMALRKLLRIGPLGVALTVGQVAWALREHWEAIPAQRRDRLQQLVRQSRGRRSNLSKSERHELTRLVRELEVPRFVRRTAVNVALMRRQLRPPS